MQKETKRKEVCTCSSAWGTLSGWTAAKLSAWRSPVLCPRGEAKLTAALPPEQNDIVCTLSPLPPSPPPPPVYAPLPSSPPLHECWQHKLHRSAVFPLCRSRSCMSSAYLCGMGLFKGERSLQGQCACVRACRPARAFHQSSLHLSSLSCSSSASPSQHSCVKAESPRCTCTILFYSFSTTNAAAGRAREEQLAGATSKNLIRSC